MLLNAGRPSQGEALYPCKWPVAFFALTPPGATPTVRPMPGSPGSPASPAAALLAPLMFLAAACGLCGCQPARYARTAADAEMFGAQAVRIHPTFTRSKDWSGDGKPDGVEAVLELQDEFGEPTRATGTARFEVYQYRPYHPDPRGKRVKQVWEWPLLTRQQHVAHWSRALRAYSFKIPFDPGNHTVVLWATFDLNGGTPRLFDQIILEPAGRTTPAPPPEAGAAQSQTRPVRRNRPERIPATQPSTAPSSPDESPAEVPSPPNETAPPAVQPTTPPVTPPPGDADGLDAPDAGPTAQ